MLVDLGAGQYEEQQHVGHGYSGCVVEYAHDAADDEGGLAKCGGVCRIPIGVVCHTRVLRCNIEERTSISAPGAVRCVWCCKLWQLMQPVGKREEYQITRGVGCEGCAGGETHR